MFLGQVDKPDVDFIEGALPGGVYRPEVHLQNPRSTVGTTSPEIYDYMRLLWAHRPPHCPECGEEITQQTPQQIVDILQEYPSCTRLQISRPLSAHVRASSLTSSDLLTQGLLARPRGRRNRAALRPAQARQAVQAHHRGGRRPHRHQDGIHQRLTDSIETALKLADGRVLIDFVDREQDDPERTRLLQRNLACPNNPRCRSTRSSRAPSPSTRRSVRVAPATASAAPEVDTDLLVPNPDLTLGEALSLPGRRAKQPPNTGCACSRVWGEELGFDLNPLQRPAPQDPRRHSGR